MNTFSERAVNACVKAMQCGKVSERHIRSVLRYDDVDVTQIEPFLNHSDSLIRRMVVRIMGKTGHYELLFRCLCSEQTDRMLIMEIMGYLGESDGEQIEALVRYLKTEDVFIREEAIGMFKHAKRVDCLFPLLFTKDDRLTKRIKGYIDGENSEADSDT